MAALTSIALSNRNGTGATLTFNATSIDLNPTQIKQLHTIVRRMLVESASTDQGTPAVVTIS